MIIFSFFSCRDVFRININLSEDPLGESNLGEATENFGEATESKDSLPKKSVEGESLIDSDVFVVTQNVSVGEGKQITDTSVINFANFGKPDAPPDLSLNTISQSSVKTSKVGVIGDSGERVDPRRYLDFLPFNGDKTTNGPVYSKVYSNTTSVPERQSLSSEELDNADFRDFYMPRKDSSESYAKYKPIKCRNMKVDSKICRIYIEEELYQIYINGGSEEFYVSEGRSAEDIADRARMTAETFDLLFHAVSSAMGEPVYKMLDANLNPVDMVDKKINIFVGCLGNALDIPRGTTMGYFSSKDYSVFDPNGYYDSSNGSNESLCFYASDSYFMGNLTMVYKIMGHELTH
ncbi:MAG: hypothetical protein IIW10_05695, partial [Spirochaetaceae bacterium]|nr:hypothetical protein [Spirochaetaceae bacterium]